MRNRICALAIFAHNGLCELKMLLFALFLCLFMLCLDRWGTGK